MFRMFHTQHLKIINMISQFTENCLELNQGQAFFASDSLQASYNLQASVSQSTINRTMADAHSCNADDDTMTLEKRLFTRQSIHSKIKEHFFDERTAYIITNSDLFTYVLPYQVHSTYHISKSINFYKDKDECQAQSTLTVHSHLLKVKLLRDVVYDKSAKVYHATKFRVENDLSEKRIEAILTDD